MLVPSVIYLAKNTSAIISVYCRLLLKWSPRQLCVIVICVKWLQEGYYREFFSVVFLFPTWISMKYPRDNMFLFVNRVYFVLEIIPLTTVPCEKEY